MEIVRQRAGIALAAVLGFLVFVALLATAALFIVRQRGRSAQLAADDAGLVAAADAALYGAVEHWDGEARERQSVGALASLATASSDAATSVRLGVARLGVVSYLLIAEAERPGVAGRQVVELAVRAVRPARLPAAIIARGDVAVAPDVAIEPPKGVGCPGVAPAIILAPSASLRVVGGAPVAPIVSVVDSALADTASIDPSRWLRRSLEEVDVVLGRDARASPMPGAVAGVCSASDANWGDPRDPAAPCASRVPLVHALGDLTIDGGVGQGALVVDGRLRIAGPFRYSGMLIARGGIEVSASDVRIDGALIAGTRADTAAVVLAPGSIVRAPRCDAPHPLASWTRAHAVHPRAWAERF